MAASKHDFLRAGEAQNEAQQARAAGLEERYTAKLDELQELKVADLMKRVQGYNLWLRLLTVIEDQSMHELRGDEK